MIDWTEYYYWVTTELVGEKSKLERRATSEVPVMTWLGGEVWGGIGRGGGVLSESDNNAFSLQYSTTENRRYNTNTPGSLNTIMWNWCSCPSPCHNTGEIFIEPSRLWHLVQIVTLNSVASFRYYKPIKNLYLLLSLGENNLLVRGHFHQVIL